MENVKHVTNRMGKLLAEKARQANVPRDGWDAVLTEEKTQALFAEMIAVASPNTLDKVATRIKELLKKVSPGNNWFDPDVIGWVNHKVVNLEDTKPFPETLGDWMVPTGGMFEKDIFSALEQENRLVEITYIQGLLEIEKRLRAGYFNQKGTYLVIPISTKLKSGNDCLLCASRYSDGWLRVFVSERSAGYRWREGYAFLSRN